MAFYIAIGFLLLASGVVFSYRDREEIAVFSGTELGRIATGSLFSISIILLPVFNWLPLADNGCNFYEGKLAIPFLVAANIFFLAVAVLWKAQTVGDVANDRQLIENSLQQTNSILRSVIESTPDVIFVKDIQGRYAIVNSAAAEWLQISINQTIGKDDRELFPPEIAQKIMEVDRRIVTSGEYLNYEEIVPKNGEKRTLLTTKCPWKDSQGNIIGVINISRDISHLKQAETAMSRSEERLQLALWASDSGMWDWNLVTNEIYFSPEYSALLGYEPGELEPSAIGLSKLIYPDDVPLLTEKLNAYFANPDSSYIVEYRMLAKSGEFKWLLARGKAVERDENNVPMRIIGTLSDISDRIAAEVELRQQKEFLRTIYDSVDYSIFVIDVDADGEFRYAGWNKAAELFGNISSEFGCGKTPEELFPAPTAAFFQQKLRECLQENSSISYEESVIFHNIKVDFMTTLTPLRDEFGKICRIVGNATDITQRKTTEAQLREQEEFLNSIYNGAEQVIFVVDVGADGEFRYAGWNAATEASTGLLTTEVKGKTPEEIFPPTVAADFRQKYIDCLAAGSSIYYENSADVDKIENWFVVTLTPLRDAAGRIYRLIGNSSNITERKKAEAALQESQRFVARIANATPNILYLFDEVEQRNVYANRELTSILGYTVEEAQALGNNLLPTIIHPDDLAKFPQYFQELENATDGEVVEYEYRVRDKNGCWHWLVSREIVFSRTESGKIQQRLSAATDVTDRKIAEQALAEQLKISVFTADVGMALTENQTLPVTLRKCCDAIVRHFDAAFARIWTLNEDENVLEMQASAGMYTHINGAHSRILVGELKIGLIAKERQPHLTNAVLKDPRVSNKEWAKREGMVAFAGYPLIFDDRLVGVIAMFSRQELNESTMIALGSIADSIALGIKRKQIEEALATQQQTLRSIIDNAPIWVWMTNPSGRMLLVNKTFCEDVAIRESRFLAANHYSEVLGVEASANCMASDVKAWSQNTPSYDEEVLQLADGKAHYLETIKAQVKDSFGNPIGLVGLGLDVTQERESQRKLQESETRFRKLSEQEALLNQLATHIRQSLDFDTILATTVQQFASCCNSIAVYLFGISPTLRRFGM
jgi:PAS domain S-box-containing protein